MCCKTIIIISVFQYLHGRVYTFCWKGGHLYSKMYTFVSNLVSIGPGFLRILRPPDRRRISATSRFRAGSLQFQKLLSPEPVRGQIDHGGFDPEVHFSKFAILRPPRGALPPKEVRIYGFLVSRGPLPCYDGECLRCIKNKKYP